MDRQIVYSGQVPQTTDLLNTNRQTMIALAKLCADLFGTSTVISGLGCVPTTPASMSVTVNPGQIYQLANVDGTPYSALPQDTAHSLLKQGILMDAQSFVLAAPATSGYSQNYLIQAAYLESDVNNVVLPYYNSANPSQAFNGPGGSGNAQPTTRAGQVSLQLVAGTAAATGTQTTPAVTAGYVGLAVVTVANGQSTITNASIVPYPNAPTAPTGGFLAAIGERYSSIQNVAISSTLSTAALGALVNVTATGQTVTLPPAANCPNGTSICVTYMQASGSTTVTRNGTDTLAFGQGSSANSLTLNPGEAVQFVSNGVNGWVSAGQTLTTGVTPAQFDNSAKLATTAFVQQALGSFSGDRGVAATGVFTLTPADVGKRIELGAGAIATLPLCSSVPKGAVIFISASPAVMNAVIQRQGSNDTIAFNNSGAYTSYTLGAGCDVLLVNDGGIWRGHLGTETLRTSNLFSNSLQSSGYQKLPSGLLFQWVTGSAALASGVQSSMVLAWPVAFNTIFSAATRQNVSISNNATFITSDFNNSGIVFYANTNAAQNLVATAIAIGK
ncbi:hypothetical protein LMG19089_03449 [Ralstonia edaphis]|uniref:hypothetical protein n=1 Tax=Ralstonia edaphi TaxID=3058599 RepID=UPI0028F5C3B2|nr:hypothetical protein [Ralstonia sp. LMG 6871]CAJ0703853.1 hypothetical protein LMG19089_03449 [Ralstonia sp. LMG 6871]